MRAVARDPGEGGQRLELSRRGVEAVVLVELRPAALDEQREQVVGELHHPVDRAVPGPFEGHLGEPGEVERQRRRASCPPSRETGSSTTSQPLRRSSDSRRASPRLTSRA